MADLATASDKERLQAVYADFPIDDPRIDVLKNFFRSKEWSIIPEEVRTLSRPEVSTCSLLALLVMQDEDNRAGLSAKSYELLEYLTFVDQLKATLFDA